MEVRHVIAYGLIAIMAIAGTVTLVVWRRRRIARRLRMSGIKTASGAAPGVGRRRT